MLYYGTNLVVKEALPELAKKARKSPNLLFKILNFLSNLVIDIVSKAITFLTGSKVFGDIIEVILGAINDIVLPSIFGIPIDWSEVASNAVFRFLVIGASSTLKSVKKFIKTKKLFKFNKTVKFLQTGIRFIKNPKAALNFVVNKVTYSLKKKLIKKLGKNSAEKIIKFVRNSIKGTIKTTILIKSFVLAKDKKKFLLNRLNNLANIGIRKAVNKFSNKIVTSNLKKLVKNKFSNRNDFNKLLKQNNKTWISFMSQSKWIDGIKIAADDWILEENQQTISYYVFFNKLTTKNKKSLLFFNRDIEEFKNFIDATSKGKFYLDNLAWGWTIGKAILKKDTAFSIKKLENTKYTKHFLSSLETFEQNSKDVIENLRNEFKVLNSTRNRKLGNRIVIEWNDSNVNFFEGNKFKKEEQFNKKFLVNNSKIKTISKPINLVKSYKKI
ncbi:hypothetical protein [Metamycoplasma equirhinis]|uniref:hypothetical protein n=1 Tax=Metamycoplasma equirhinis TaxID=92402 RepID=UPI002574194F|nr:hypothetical protein [Metamycoplasma equirhinis]BDX52595.1 hypothetical protein JPM7_2020 [Metamycoplasma equirhinis]